MLQIHVFSSYSAKYDNLNKKRTTLWFLAASEPGALWEAASTLDALTGRGRAAPQCPANMVNNKMEMSLDDIIKASKNKPGMRRGGGGAGRGMRGRGRGMRTTRGFGAGRGRAGAGQRPSGGGRNTFGQRVSHLCIYPFCCVRKKTFRL